MVQQNACRVCTHDYQMARWYRFCQIELVNLVNCTAHRMFYIWVSTQAAACRLSVREGLVPYNSDSIDILLARGPQRSRNMAVETGLCTTESLAVNHLIYLLWIVSTLRQKHRTESTNAFLVRLKLVAMENETRDCTMASGTRTWIICRKIFKVGLLGIYS